MTISLSHFIPVFILVTALLFAACSQPQDDDSPLYLDPNASIDDRVEDLLSRMTIEEKVGQMNQLDISVISQDDAETMVEIDLDKAREFILEHNTGSFINGEAVPPQQWYEFLSQLTRIAVEESRLGIPIIFGIDHVHGPSYMSETTIFPHNTNLGASFNRENAYNSGWVTALEMADVGHHWNFAPTLDVGVNQLWSRYYETLGEDPHLVAEMGRAYLDGYKNNEEIYPYRLASNAKHFIGYSATETGWNKTPVQIGIQELYEKHLPPFQAAFESGLMSIMISSSDLNGTPTHASYEIITELLREDLGFEGVVLTDWDEVGKLVGFHRSAPDFKEATYMAVMAGIDISMTPLHLGFYGNLLELVEEGRISEQRIDESVRRILRMKFEIGLFENPFPRNDRFDRIGTEESRLKSLQAAQESIVLMKNEDNLLPLQSPSRIVLTGPSADSKRNLAGGWTIAWQGGEEEQYPESMHTIYTALQEEFPNATIEFIPELPSRSAQLMNRLNRADVIIYAGGEEPYSEFLGNITDYNLPGDQLEELSMLASSNTPVALVLVQGRPRLITDVYDDLSAVLHAGLPGFEGAEAIANVLSGSANPSGRLPFSYPRYHGHYVNYNYKPSEMFFFHPDNQNPFEEPNPGTMLHMFGHGLSYTDYAYSDLVLSADEVRKGESITASVTITNEGEIAGRHSALWYLTQKVGTVPRPVRELKHFESIHLEPGESKTLTFEIQPEQSLWYPNSRRERVYEGGEFLVRAGDLVLPFNFVTD
ncbi:MAG: glycoside hydrolase family 3 C-terminal domain-containing protein [Balneolia bacterium]|nr:glycoside hydrolase family 3 C-terminal domain-containing protein [Balneolia bacterium]